MTGFPESGQKSAAQKAPTVRGYFGSVISVLYQGAVSGCVERSLYACLIIFPVKRAAELRFPLPNRADTGQFLDMQKYGN